MTKLDLKINPTLQDFQSYVHDAVIARGFDKETVPEIFMLFMEECGEMAKAARKLQNLKTDENSAVLNLEHELADVFSYLLDICNQFDIDLEKAFREKEQINEQRQWT